MSFCTTGQICDNGTCVEDNSCDPACDASLCLVCEEGSCLSSCTEDQICTEGSCVNYMACVGPDGQTIEHGAALEYFASDTVAHGESCVSEMRFCDNGTLDGTYEYLACSVRSPLDCAGPNGTQAAGVFIAHDGSATYYLEGIASPGETCTTETRACDNGTLSGSYRFLTCVGGPPNDCIVPTPPPWVGGVVVPVFADYDGDGDIDVAVHVAPPGGGNSYWHLFRSSDGLETSQYGWGATQPVPGDYDGDGKTDLAVFHQATATWSLMQSTAGHESIQYGWQATVPVPGDYDGDGRTDIATYLQEADSGKPAGTWFMMRSSAGHLEQQFGNHCLSPVQGDYDGDGKTDIAGHLAQPTPTDDGSRWYVLGSESGYRGMQFGWTEALPTERDYDFDRQSEFAVRNSVQPPAYPSGSARPPVKNVYVAHNPEPFLATSMPSSDQDAEKTAALARYNAEFSGADFVSRGLSLADFRHLDSFAGTDTEKFEAAATTSGYAALVLGNRTYHLERPVLFSNRSDLLIIGGPESLIYSGLSEGCGTNDTNCRSVSWDRRSSALAFDSPERVMIAGIGFRGHRLDRSPPMEVVFADINEDGAETVGTDWRYRLPHSSKNHANARGIYATSPRDFVIIGCSFQHYHGGGVTTQSNDTSVRRSLRIQDNSFVDCANYRHPRAFYAIYDFNSIRRPAGALAHNDLGAINVNGLIDKTLTDVFIENNRIVGPLMDGIAVNCMGMENLSITDNYVYGYNFHFSQTIDAHSRALGHASEMGIHVVTTGGRNITIDRNYVAGFLCENIVQEIHTGTVSLTENVYIRDNWCFDSNYRGITLYPDRGNPTATAYRNVEITGNRLVNTIVPSPVNVIEASAVQAGTLNLSNNLFADEFAWDGTISWEVPSFFSD